ncbi:MAG: hypothetical protein WCO77_06680 [bacterium]
MKRRQEKIAAVLLCAALMGLAAGAQERHRLYTKPDPAATGGLKGVIKSPNMPIVEILAMPPDEPRFVYEGKLTGPNNQGFLFEGLPMARYNLFVIYDNEFYEGLELSREKDTLTKEDRDKILYIVDASDPFFPNKVMHRMAGTTGRSNLARCVVTMYRDRGALRRTFKLIWLKDVGPGWQVVQKRDLYPINAKPNNMNPKHHYSAVLSKIRVTSEIKDLGELDLTKIVLREKTDAEVDRKKSRPKEAADDEAIIRPAEAAEGE